MNREDCEKLLDAYAAAVEALYLGGSADRVECKGEVVENLRDVIVGIMADEKRPVYRDGTITVKEAPLPYKPYTVPTGFPKPIVTCDGRGEMTATTATWDNSKGE